MRIIRIVLYAILVVSSLTVLFGEFITSTVLHNQEPVRIKQLKELNTEASYDFSSLGSISVEKLVGKSLNPDKVIGAVIVPDAKVATPIVEGLDDSELLFAAGTSRPGMKQGEGHYTLVAHNVPGSEWALFSGLYHHSQKGQLVYTTDFKQVYVYETERVEFVPETAVEVLSPDRYDKPMITLLTCDVSGSERLITVARFKHSFPVQEARPDLINQFSKAVAYDWGQGGNNNASN